MLNKLSILATMLFATTAFAVDAPITFFQQQVEVSKASVAAGFFTVVSAKDDAIISATSDCCTAVELHKNEVKDNVMRMRKMESLELKAGVPTHVQRAVGGNLSLAPGAAPGTSMTLSDGVGGLKESMHVMLIGLKKPLNAGDTVNVTFSFKHAPEQTVAFPVQDKMTGAHKRNPDGTFTKIVDEPTHDHHH